MISENIHIITTEHLERIKSEVLIWGIAKGRAECETTLTHLHNVLFAISDLPESERCLAISDALEYYNAARPHDPITFNPVDLGAWRANHAR